jgi:hypothetical protein
MTEQLTGILRESLTTGEKVDSALLDFADNVIRAHQIYVHLLFVSMVVDRITQLTHYFEALDSVVEVLDTEDLAEASTAEKIRAIAAFNQAIKTKVEIITSMMASKDGIGMLVSNMKDTFGDTASLTKAGVSEENPLATIENLPADQRQRVLAAITRLFTNKMKEGKEE